MSRLEVKDVQITLKDGKVLHFLASEGDKISCQEVHTYIKPESAGHKVHYYVVQISPVEGGQENTV